MRFASIVVVCLACVPAHAYGQSPSFTPIAFPSVTGARSVVSADLNRDGWLDLATANAGRNSVAVLLNRGASGGFLPAQEIRVGRGPFDIDAGDFDRDGVIDLVVTTPDANAIELLLLGPTGALRSRTVLNGSGHSRGARLADMTGDGWLDLVYSDFERNFVTIVPNNQTGGFWSDLGTMPVPPAPQGVAVGDFNHDGRSDIAVATTGSTSLIVVTITASTEIVIHASRYSTELGWTTVYDETAASSQRVHYPNAHAPKTAAPLADPTHHLDVGFVADPTLTYKLWVRLKADDNHYTNDSIWVQFSGAVDVSGKPVARIGTTAGLSVNLEECAGCGVSGWGWEDDAWGSRNQNGMLLRFPEGGGQLLRIQVREDGVSLDQIVLSAEKYLTARPGAAKNDTTILNSTQFP
jgi:hypothetical protein